MNYLVIGFLALVTCASFATESPSESTSESSGGAIETSFAGSLPTDLALLTSMMPAMVNADGSLTFPLKRPHSTGQTRMTPLLMGRALRRFIDGDGPRPDDAEEDRAIIEAALASFDVTRTEFLRDPRLAELKDQLRASDRLRSVANRPAYAGVKNLNRAYLALALAKAHERTGLPWLDAKAREVPANLLFELAEYAWRYHTLVKGLPDPKRLHMVLRTLADEPSLQDSLEVEEQWRRFAELQRVHLPALMNSELERRVGVESRKIGAIGGAATAAGGLAGAVTYFYVNGPSAAPLTPVAIPGGLLIAMVTGFVANHVYEPIARRRLHGQLETYIAFCETKLL